MKPLVVVKLSFEQGCDVGVNTRIIQAGSLRDALSQVLVGMKDVLVDAHDDVEISKHIHCVNDTDINELHELFMRSGGYLEEYVREVHFALDDSGVGYVVQYPQEEF